MTTTSAPLPAGKQLAGARTHGRRADARTLQGGRGVAGRDADSLGRLRVYLAGPLFSDAERSWLDGLAARLRTEGFDCFVPHENSPELLDVALEQVYRLDVEALRSANALVAWLDGPIVDDGTACEIGMFAELVRSGGERYRGMVAIATDIRLERRRRQNVVGDGMNLFLAGAIESCGTIAHTVDDVVAALRKL